MTEASFVFFISDNAGYAYSVYPRSIPYFIFHGLERTFHGLEYTFQPVEYTFRQPEYKT